VSCADPRCIPEKIFKLQTGGKSNTAQFDRTPVADTRIAEAVVLRGAGGNAQYMLNSLLSIDTLLHFTEAIIVQHTSE
jgi:hypothetical protein